VKPQIDPEGLGKTEPWEYLVRFGFGGAVTACTGLIAQRYGPSIGGLFLAFPAILPASLTLVERHDGRRDAADDARGSVIGAVALFVFAAVALLLVNVSPPALTLAAATAAWCVTIVVLWTLRYGSLSS
jgi:uncharacterized membrane protein (GlpM family)